MGEHFDILNDKTKSIDIALKYTRGDITKAKEMASGNVNDITVVKSKFLDPASNHSGMILAFFNIDYEYISSIDSIITDNSSIFDRTRIFDDWKQLFSDIAPYQKGNDSIDAKPLNDSLMELFIKKDIFKDVEDSNLDGITKKFNECLSEYFSVKSVQVQIELNRTNSLMLDLAGVEINIPGKAESKLDSDKAEAAESEKKMAKIEQEAAFVVEGKSIVAPVKGKNINELMPGDNIKVLLLGKDMVTQKILSTVNAYDDDGNPTPIKARVKEVVQLEKKGYVIYTLVAKGILAKLYEDENYRLMLYEPEIENQNQPESEKKIILLLSLLVGLIIIVGIILFSVL